MSSTLTFTFEELPLLIDLGVEAGLVNGSAEIEYWTDHSWGITSIWLDGYGPNGVRKQVEVENGSALFLTIFGRLEGEWCEKVQDEVVEAIHEARESRADTIADHHRAFHEVF